MDSELPDDIRTINAVGKKTDKSLRNNSGHNQMFPYHNALLWITT